MRAWMLGTPFRMAALCLAMALGRHPVHDRPSGQSHESFVPVAV